MKEGVRISTREAAERLHVHARTVRKWIDTFEEYIEPHVNDRGHYMLTEDSYIRLRDIQKRLQENKSMRQIRQELIMEGKWDNNSEQAAEPEEDTVIQMPFGNSYPMHRLIGSLDEIGEMMETVFERLDQLEDHVFTMFDVIEEMERKMVANQQNYLPATQLHQMIEDIGKKQDQLKAELRNATFSHRLASATTETQLTPRRQKRSRFLGIF
ncbi:hypothetical protein GCM10011571_05420 [Marinithermofilum abyssi]|uniref:HTH merR-type domain-containing protein n=1 Tax=Marinithermofilum abyssi TaxID=1571185 RepID=A0A8J2YD44_9BACL|nr:MerR family transcriptional regulator [Marinithermofilum abyssi]GGE07103.1 hypothetical protein GCM10011571_05420 [Marinithermofilum abyssi]